MLHILIIILIIILALGIIFAIMKKAIKFAIYAIVIVFIGSVIIMAVVANDLSSIKEKSEDTVTYLFKSGEEFVDGFIHKDGETTEMDPEEIEETEDKIESDEELEGLIVVTELKNFTGDTKDKVEELSSSLNLIESVKSGDTKVYPETTSFRALKYVPKFIIKSVANLVE